MNTQELEQMLQSGNPDLMQQAMNFLAENKQDVDEPDSSGGEQEVNQPSAVKTQDESAGAEAQGIASKNGQHVLPYEVLVAERERNAQLKAQLDEYDRERAEAANAAEQAAAMQKKVDLLTRQLQAEGIEPAQLLEDQQLTEDELEGLAEYGDVGRVTGVTARKMLLLQKQVETLLSQQQAAAPAAVKASSQEDVVADVWAEIAKVDGLTEVMQTPGLSKQAATIDAQLQADPKWATKPIADRFTEVMRLMAKPILAHTNKPSHDTTGDMPFSLNGIPGATADVTAPLLQQFDGLSEQEIQHRLSQMNPTEQAKVIAAMGF